MSRRLSFLAAALVLLTACNDCSSKPCKEGITFYLTGVAGTLSPGTQEQLTLCFDGKCDDITISRSDVGGTQFVPFNGIGKNGDHAITVQGDGSFAGTYTGPLPTFEQKPNGSSCGGCPIGAVKIGADGTLTPGSAVTPDTTAPATTGG